jgi:FSR family fosmidomycin resistance protein-like MFS transporter
VSISKDSNYLPSSIDIEDIAIAEPVEDGEFQTASVVTISAGHAVHDTYTAFLPPLLPKFIEIFSLSKTEAGLLSVFLSAPSILQPVFGYLADRISLRIFVILAPTITAVMMSLLGIAPGYWTMALFLIFVGFSSAGFHATAPVMISTLSGKRLGKGMGFWMVGGELGRTLGPVVAVTAIRFVDLNGLPWLMPGGLITSGLLYLRLRKVADSRPDSSQHLDWRSTIESLRPMAVPVLGLLATRAFLLPALSTYLPVYLTDEGAELWFAGVSLSIMEAAGVVGAFLGGTISDRLGRRSVLAISMSAASILVLLFVATSGWLQIILLPLMGLAAFSTAPVMMAVVLESAPNNRATANGIYMALSFLSRSAALLMLGALGDRSGLGLAFQISSFIMLLGVPFIRLLPKRVPQLRVE